MNAFQICQNTTDLIPLYLPQQLYLKPIARINISLQLPNVKKIGKSVSHWEIMDKVRTLIRPDEFTTLKVTKTTVEVIVFEAELATRIVLERVLPKLNNKMIKLKDFGELMKLKATEWKSDFPNRRIWDEFFQNAHDMDEMKPGQRPDTIYISHLPSKWFVPYHLSGEEEIIPSEKIFYRVFEKFGHIRFVDIPRCDPYRKKMKEHISGLKESSFDNTEFFEGYVQFKDYMGFTKAMDMFRNMKLVHIEDDTSLEVNIKVDFDRSKHLSDASIKRREIVRDRLVRKAREQEEKDKAELEERIRKEELERQKEIDLKEQKKMRRKLREEKRKAKILEKLEISGSDEINDKIAREEKKLLGVQRKLEAIRLVEELFRRIQDKNPHNIQLYDDFSNSPHDELRNFKNSSELEVLNQREKLHNALKGRVMLKTILADGKRMRRYSSSSSDSDISLELGKPENRERPKSPVFQKYPEIILNSPWLGYQHYMQPGPIYPEAYHSMGGFVQRARGFPRLPNIPGPSRGGYGRRRAGYRFRGGHRGGSNFNHYASDMGDEFLKMFNDYDERRRKSYSPNRRSGNRSRSRSRSRRSYSRSYTRSRSRSKSRRRRSRSRRSRSYSYRSRSRSRRRSYSRSRSRSKTRRKSRSRERNRSRSRSKSRSKDRSRDRSSESKRKSSESRSKKSKDSPKEKTPDKKTPAEGDSVHSSTSVTRETLQQRNRSKSWSLPRENEEKRRSWSKSPNNLLTEIIGEK